MTASRINRAARAVADIGAGMILGSVEIAAPPEKVYRALTNPEEVVKWWGSDEVYRTTGWTSKLSPGGSWRAEGRSADGSTFSVEGTYLELDPPHKIVCTWKPDWEGEHVTTITYRIELIEGGSRVVVRHEGFGARADSCRSHAQGWELVLGWLTGYASSAAAEQFYFIRLLAPRPRFRVDMTSEEGAVMREHVAYWRGQMAAGKAIVFGPVDDPKGDWALGVVRVADEAELKAFEAGDPVIRSGRGFSYEVLPLARVACAVA